MNDNRERNNNRIQSRISDNIYGDYYIQPVKIAGLNADHSKNSGVWWTCSGDNPIQNNGPRVLIKSYDSTYGHIYPVTGDNGFTSGDINPSQAQGF